MKKKPTIYVETSIISYLAAWPSPDLMTAACQQITIKWWQGYRRFYNVVTSALVVAESREGDKRSAGRRLDLLTGIPALRITDAARGLAGALITEGALPQKAEADALHIAIATVHRVNYLLTWNCRHIDNPSMKPLVREVCISEGYACPEICTPFEIMELYEHEE
jgi:hypothetical protein